MYAVLDKKSTARREAGTVLFDTQRIAAQDMCWPPLMAILAPVTNAASSEDR